MAKFIKKPERVEAFIWTGGADQAEDPDWIVQALKDGKVTIINDEKGLRMEIDNGIIERVKPGEYVVKRADGSIGACSREIFEALYERCG